MLNIFRKIKDYDAVANQLRKVTAINVIKSHEIDGLKEQLKRKKESYESKIEMLENEVKLANFAKGGYKSTITKLKREIDELTKKLKESQSDKCVIKKIPRGRLPKGEPMKIKGSAKTSAIAKSLKVED